MNTSDKTSRSGAKTDTAVSALSTIDAQQRLRLAAHILANGAIRAALKQQASQASGHNPAAPQAIRQTIAKRSNNTDLPDVNNSDIAVPHNDIDTGQFTAVMTDEAVGFPVNSSCSQK